jgi:hypothetical protein
LIINVITATTFVVQIVGPICVKLAIRRAGEIGQATLEHDAWASEGSTEGPHVLPPLTADSVQDE